MTEPLFIEGETVKNVAGQDCPIAAVGRDGRVWVSVAGGNWALGYSPDGSSPAAYPRLIPNPRPVVVTAADLTASVVDAYLNAPGGIEISIAAALTQYLKENWQ